MGGGGGVNRGVYNILENSTFLKVHKVMPLGYSTTNMHVNRSILWHNHAVKIVHAFKGDINIFCAFGGGGHETFCYHHRIVQVTTGP